MFRHDTSIIVLTQVPWPLLALQTQGGFCLLLTATLHSLLLLSLTQNSPATVLLLLIKTSISHYINFSLLVAFMYLHIHTHHSDLLLTFETIIAWKTTSHYSAPTPHLTFCHSLLAMKAENTVCLLLSNSHHSVDFLKTKSVAANLVSLIAKALCDSSSYCSHLKTKKESYFLSITV